MSRPPDHYRHAEEQRYINSPVGTIDFAPRIALAEQADGHVFAQAGFPGYQPVAAGYQPVAYQTAGYQTMAAGFQPAGYQPAGYQQVLPQQVISTAYPQGAPYANGVPSYQPGALASVASVGGVSTVGSMASPAESEEAIQRRIQANIDAIMETQKTAMLNSKLESLTNKVQSLAQNIEHSESSHVRGLADRVDRLSRSMDGGDSASQLRSLSEKVERLSRCLEQAHEPRAAESLSSTADGDIARRLRRLAAESSASKARSEERIPDW
jgi:hypothetical protein